MSRSQEHNPKISIIIPVYNGEKYLKYAIDSALAQTYDNYEVIVIDDGSTDHTSKICKSYGNKIRYFKKPNGGVSSALNFGIKKMQGEYFSWLSHDDTYEPNKLEAEIQYLKKHNLIGKKVIAFSDYYLMDKYGHRTFESKKNHEEISKKPEYIIAKGHINGLSLLIPKQAFDDYGDFSTELICVQDYEMWWRMSKTYSFVHIPESLVSTRCHSKQVTETNPKVITEGDNFYITLIENIPKDRMEKLEGSEYCCLEELANFYDKTVYKGVAKYCRKRMSKILADAKDKIVKYKVSVIIPFYNRNTKLKRAIKSVLNQTHQNFEIILVDDGSTEDISNAKAFAKKYDNITLLKNKANSGPSVARNLGIKAATGDYIAFLDSDDEFAENKLERSLQYLVASKGNFLHTSYSGENADGKTKTIHSGKIRGHCERELIFNCCIATPTVVIKRKWLLSLNTLFDTAKDIGEDVCFWLELMKNDTYLIGIDEPLTIVHIGDNAAAYSNKKQIIGLKCILNYVLQDNYYSQFNQELSWLMQSFIYYVKKDEIDTKEDALKAQLKNHSPVQKLLFFAQTEGLKSATKRIVTKLKGPTND